PILHVNKIDNEIQKYINEKKNEFLNTVKNFEKANINLEYEFNVKYNSNEYKNVMYIHTVIYKYVGGEDYTRIDKSISYDAKRKKILNLEDFFINNKYLSELSKLSYYYMIEYFNTNDLNYDDNNIKQVTGENVNNFSNYSFHQTGLDIIFPPTKDSTLKYKVKITIPYKDINHILKEEYRNIGFSINVKPILDVNKRDISSLKIKN
ncbi:MAG TPA: hypothetical protein GX747_02235, partial [Tenericutes bacterium]|nr:hypothetical protein [Mycoplasmatota bacterium]